MTHNVQIETLNWFLSLANADLSSFDLNGRFKLVVDLADALNYPLLGVSSSLPIGPKFVETMFTIDERGWLGLQQAVIDFFTAVERRVREFENRRKDLEKSGVPREEFSKLVDLAPVPLEITLMLSIEPEGLPETRSENTEKGPIQKVLFQNASLEDSRLVIRASSSKLEDAMIYYLFQSISNIPANTIKKCAECGKWFFQTTKREKLYCSAFCATKRSNREKYLALKKEDPEGYQKELSKGRERARESYSQKKEQRLKARSRKTRQTNQ